jgi:Protein of unknown function (DUF3667)
MSQEHCENCGVILQGDFCHSCGQSKLSSSRFFGSILMDLLDNFFNYDSRVYKTLVPLMLKPGYVCSEYLSGKRASYLPPFRLYLFASIIFFLLVPFINDISVSFGMPDEQAEQQEDVKENLAGYFTLNDKEDSVNVLGVKEELSEVNRDIPFFLEEREMLRKKFDDPTKYNSDELLETSLNTLPTVMFFLLPILALALKALYIFGKRYYMEHLIVVLYSQSFLFFMLLFTVVLESAHEKSIEKFPASIILHMLEGTIVNLCYLWMPVYMFLFMKKVYGQSTFLTLVKFSTITIIYISLIAIAATVTIVWGIFKI